MIETQVGFSNNNNNNNNKKDLKNKCVSGSVRSSWIQGI